MRVLRAPPGGAGARGASWASSCVGSRRDTALARPFGPRRQTRQGHARGGLERAPDEPLRPFLRLASRPPIASKGMAEPRSARLDEVASVEEIARLPYS